MLSLGPRRLPSLSFLLDDLGATDEALAVELDVSTRTVRRWRAAGCAPRAVELALFAVSRWGRSERETAAHNDAVMQAQLAAAHARENAALRARIGRLLALGHYGAANDPLPADPGRPDGTLRALPPAPRR